MHMSQKKFLVLQMNDSLFPIGAYSHSYGLETYIQKGIVKDAEPPKQAPQLFGSLPSFGSFQI